MPFKEIKNWALILGGGGQDLVLWNEKVVDYPSDGFWNTFLGIFQLEFWLFQIVKFLSYFILKHYSVTILCLEFYGHFQ